MSADGNTDQSSFSDTNEDFILFNSGVLSFEGRDGPAIRGMYLHPLPKPFRTWKDKRISSNTNAEIIWTFGSTPPHPALSPVGRGEG